MITVHELLMRPHHIHAIQVTNLFKSCFEVRRQGDGVRLDFFGCVGQQVKQQPIRGGVFVHLEVHSPSPV